MNIGKEIFQALTPPPPQGRDGFLRGLPYPKLSLLGFVLAQAGYIRKRFWVISGLILLAGISAVCVMPKLFCNYDSAFAVWIISALLPFSSMLAAAEISRSDVYGMYEIEAACRFGTHQLTGARLLILGVCSFAVTGTVTAVTGIFTPAGTAKAALYILAPYLLSGGISLAAMTRFRGQEGVYVSAASAAAISAVGALTGAGKIFISEAAKDVVYLAACAAGAAAVIRYAKKIYNGDEKYGINH